MKKYTFIVEEVDEGVQTTSNKEGFSNSEIVYLLELEKLRILINETKRTEIKSEPEKKA